MKTPQVPALPGMTPLGIKPTKRPVNFPAAIKHGLYTAVFAGVEERFPGDALASARWDIVRGDKVVGALFASDSYGWNRPHASLAKLVWSGPLPKGISDPKSPDYGMAFDIGPCDGYAATLAEFAKRADRLISWRLAQAALEKAGVQS